MVWPSKQQVDGVYISCEWGEAGVRQLAPESDAVAIVDVLSFSTSVDIAVARGAVVYPYRLRDDSAHVYAESLGAVLAGSRSEVDYSLSPASLQRIPAGTRLVLPSPNGATLTLAAGGVPTFAGCLRNATAVAAAMQSAGKRLTVFAAGERWPDGSLRPALEDLIGAGAVIHALQGTRSPEAAAAEAVFLRFKPDLLSTLRECPSGRELIERGYEDDVQLAAEYDVSGVVPVLVGGGYAARGE